MPFVIAIVASVVAAVGSVVAGIVATIGSIISSAIAPVIASIGGVISSVVASITPIITSVLSTVGSVVGDITATVGEALQGAVTSIKATVGPVIHGINEAVLGIVKAITAPLAPILNPIKEGLVAINAELKAIDVAVTEALGPIAETVKLLGTVASLKILYDMVTGQEGILKGLQKISEDTQLGTMQSIAALSQQIITTGVGIMNKYDDQIHLLAATIDTFDERVRASWSQLHEDINAEIASAITPRIDTLGRATDAMNRQIATVYRHFEDQPWFLKMLLTALPKE
jgi:phage-related protein